MAVGHYLAAAVVCLGPPVGAYIGRLTKSEMRDQLNVRIVASVILSLTFFFFVAQYTQQWFAVVMALLVGGTLALCEMRAIEQLHPPVTMVFLALALAVSASNFAVIASLMLMYGVAIGSLCIMDADWKRSLHYSLWFAAASIVAFTAMPL